MKKLLCMMITGGAFALMLAGCASAPQGDTRPAGASFGMWTGTWNNFYSYFENPALNEAYAVLAQKEGKTPAEIKNRYISGPTYQCEIAAMGMAGDTVTFYRSPQKSANSGSGIAYKAGYQDGGDVDINGRIWRHFFTAADIPYKHLLLLPAEADEPGVTMMHFHFRYGADLETIKAAENWYATMTAFDSPVEFLINHMVH
jgi:zinc transport system substrate-binding protein